MSDETDDRQYLSTILKTHLFSDPDYPNDEADCCVDLILAAGFHR